MIPTLNYSPGQTATFFLDTVDGYGVRADSASIPVVQRIIFPDFSSAEDYPQDTTKLEEGLYYYSFDLPTGATAIGSYLADVDYIKSDGYTATQSYQILVSAPFGIYTATSF